MNDLISILYGVLQGITEFLPVSSSAHLALLPHFFHFKDPGVFFDLAMHVGTALAILVYFFREVSSLLKELAYLFVPGHSGFGKRYWLLNMVISVGATGLFFIFLKHWAEDYGRTPMLISINLVFFGALLYWADRQIESSNMMDKASSWKQAFIIGVVQTIAIFPGVSRSGITITAARFLKISRFEASQYSFLLALPPIFVGIFLKYQETIGSEPLFLWRHVAIGTVVSFIVALLTIHLFLKWIQKVGFKIFFFYRLILAGAIYLLL